MTNWVTTPWGGAALGLALGLALSEGFHFWVVIARLSCAWVVPSN